MSPGKGECVGRKSVWLQLAPMETWRWPYWDTWSKQGGLSLCRRNRISVTGIQYCGHSRTLSTRTLTPRGRIADPGKITSCTEGSSLSTGSSYSAGVVHVLEDATCDCVMAAGKCSVFCVRIELRKILPVFTHPCLSRRRRVIRLRRV